MDDDTAPSHQLIFFITLISETPEYHSSDA